MAKRIVGVRPTARARLTPQEPTGSRILLKPTTADVVRTVARDQGLTLDELVQQMLREWVPKNTKLKLELA